MSFSPLTTHFQVNTVDRRPRNGTDIDSIGHHHTATPNKAVALSLFQPGGREVTPNYFIWEDEIWGIVDEEYRAYTTGSAQDDIRSITYEIGNSGGPPNYPFSERTLRTVARLDADVSRRHGVPLRHGIPGYWEHRNINEWFGRSYPTACAGPSFKIGSIITATSAAGGGITPLEWDEMATQAEVEGAVNNALSRWVFKLPGEEKANNLQGNLEVIYNRQDRLFDLFRQVLNLLGGGIPEEERRTVADQILNSDTFRAITVGGVDLKAVTSAAETGAKAGVSALKIPTAAENGQAARAAIVK